MNAEPAVQERQARREPRHLGAGAALSVAADSGTLIAAGAVSIVLARAIGPSANGTFALLSTLINVAVLVVSLGVSSGITYQVSNRGWQLRSALQTLLVLALVLGLFGTAGSLGFFFLTQHTAMHDVPPHLAIIGICAITPALIVQFLTGILLGRDRYERYAALMLVNAGLLLFGCAVSALIFGLTGAVAGFTAAMSLTALAGVWLSWRWIRGTPQSRPEVLDGSHEPTPHQGGLPVQPAVVAVQHPAAGQLPARSAAPRRLCRRQPRGLSTRWR